MIEIDIAINTDILTIKQKLTLKKKSLYFNANFLRQ